MHVTRARVGGLFTRSHITRRSHEITYVQDGYTALHYAAQEGNDNIVRMLFQAGADVSIQDEEVRLTFFPLPLMSLCLFTSFLHGCFASIQFFTHV